jgi:ribosome-binding protein aMBF1 (putative translation factor)
MVTETPEAAACLESGGKRDGGKLSQQPHVGFNIKPSPDITHKPLLSPNKVARGEQVDRMHIGIRLWLHAHNNSAILPSNNTSLSAQSIKEFIMPITNISTGGSSSATARKDDSDKQLKVSAKVFSKAVQQARMAKGMSQKDLASKVNVKIQVLGDYESGKAVPNGQIVSKIEKILECKLPRPGTKPTVPGASSKCGVAKVGPLNFED